MSNNRIYHSSIMEKAVKDLKNYIDKKNNIHRINKIKRIWKTTKDMTQIL